MNTSQHNLLKTEVENHYQALDQFGKLAIGQGYLRAGYSKEESDVICYFENLLKPLGFDCKYDQIGNFSASYPGKSGKFIEIASHVDTVVSGGNFDGLAGVLSGYLAFSEFLKTNKDPEHGLRLRIWRLEESGTFNSVYTGSLAAFGQLKPAALENKFRGLSLKDAISAAGFDPEIIARSEKTISQEEVDSILAHFELHIEQGTVLENNNKQIGIVTSIRGVQNYLVHLKGRFDHSGTTPMGVKYRRDCNLALAYMITELDSLIISHPEILQTFGVINSNSDYVEQYGIAKNALTKVSGAAFFSLNIRSSVAKEIENYRELALSKIKSIAANFNVSAEIKNLSYSAPLETMNNQLSDLLEKVCEKESITFQRLPSGGGHDALVVARQKQSSGLNIPVNMIFIPCRDGVSHDPLEYATSKDIATSVAVLTTAIKELEI